MGQKEQERWVVEGNITRYEDQLKMAPAEKLREQLTALLARERGRHSKLPPGD